MKLCEEIIRVKPENVKVQGWFEETEQKLNKISK